MTLKGARFVGNFNLSNDEAFSGVIHINKADIPNGILSIVGRVTVPSDGEWHHVSPLGACRLVARKKGAVQRYAIEHFGDFDCCKRVTVGLAGHEMYGISRRSMPNWAGLNLDAVVRAVYGDDCGKAVQVRSWTRTSMNSVRVVVLDKGDGLWELNIRRDEVNPSDVHWHLLNGPSVEDLVNLVNQGTGAFA